VEAVRAQRRHVLTVWSQRAGALALTALVLAGCAGAPVSGKAVPQGAPSTAAPVDVSTLQTGSYPTAPLPPLGVAGSPDVGRRIAAQLMAPFVVGPWQVDGTLTEGTSPAATVMVSKDDFVGTLRARVAAGLFGQPFVIGFVAERHSSDKTAPLSLRNGVLRFADDRAASDAVAAMTNSTLQIPLDPSVYPVLTEPPTTLPVPGHPASSGLLQKYMQDDTLHQEVTTLTAHGPFVVFEVVQHPQGPDAAAALAAKAIDMQLSLLDKLPPVNPADFGQLPLDPSGLVARTLPTAPDEATPMSGSAYPPAGALHAEANPVDAATWFAATGVDQVSIGASTLYQAKDAAGARTLMQDIGDAAAKIPSTQSAAGVPGLPDSRCLLVADASGLVPKYLCLATFDRYAFKTSARDFTRVQQQLAAQYRMVHG
jgi:hypothetical protein